MNQDVNIIYAKHLFIFLFALINSLYQVNHEHSWRSVCAQYKHFGGYGRETLFSPRIAHNNNSREPNASKTHIEVDYNSSALDVKFHNITINGS